MNTYKKYTAGVYCMQSDNADYKHNDNATITTKRGKEIPVIVWKKLFSKGEYTFYSVVREDGFNRSAWLQKKADKRAEQAERQKKLSSEYYEKSNKDRDFLALAEPIKVGHHSEKRHRKLINDNWRNMGKSVAASDKARELSSKAEELEARAKRDINLDTPESLDLLAERVAYLEKQKADLKASKQCESWQLSNLGANIRRYKERLETAKKLWDLEVDAQAPSKKEVKAQKERSKQEKMDNLLKKYGVIWAFSNEQFDKNKTDGVQYVSIGAGGFCPKENLNEFMNEYKTI